MLARERGRVYAPEVIAAYHAHRARTPVGGSVRCTFLRTVGADRGRGGSGREMYNFPLAGVWAALGENYVAVGAINAIA